MLKMVVVVYNEAIDAEVMEALENCGLKSYTKNTGVFGSGALSGTHMGDDIWPGRNNTLFVVSDEKQARALVGKVRELRKPLGKEGVKAFLMPVEEMT